MTEKRTIFSFLRLYSMWERFSVIPVKRYDWKIAHKIRKIYRLQKVEIKWFFVYEMVEGWSWATLTQPNHLYTFLNMIVHLGGRVLLYSLQHRQQSFPVKAIFLIEMQEPFHLIARDRNFWQGWYYMCLGGSWGTIDSPQLASNSLHVIFLPLQTSWFIQYIVRFPVIRPCL